jgi:HSP20 family protein
LTKLADRALLEELMGMKKRMDSLYAERFTERTQESSGDDHSSVWKPLVDVYETEGDWNAVVDLPGVVEENLVVNVERSRLVIQGTRYSSATAPDDATAIRNERPMGRFRRELVLPEKLIGDQVKAELNRGVLTVKIAKKAEAARKITVRHD